MINAHPSPQLHATTSWLIAWLAVTALLVGIATVSGKNAVGIALGILITAALVLVAKGVIGPNHEQNR